MAEFKCEVAAITVETHPDPEVTKLEVGRVNDYRVVIGKDLYKTGDRIAYIPEQAIVPEKILESMGMVGKLDGSNKNRVKARRLRGVMSQGIVFTDDTIRTMELGSDVTDYLGVKKYEPDIPKQLAGQMSYHGGVSFKFDIENIKKFPEVFVEGEDVIVTEKLHGSFSVFGLVEEANRKEDMIEGKFFVSSKGQAAKGLYFKDNEENLGNAYVKVFKEQKMAAKIEAIKEYLGLDDTPIWVVGEVLGVQKGYGYGCSNNQLGYRSFGIKANLLGYPLYLDWDKLTEALGFAGIDQVPVLYRGPFFKDKLKEFSEGFETASGRSMHIREGSVVYPAKERHHQDLGRVILKSINDEYLVRSTGEEFN